MNRKRIFGIGLFILAGLFMYTFANPREDNNTENNEPNNGIVEPTIEENKQENAANNAAVEPAPVERTQNQNFAPVAPVIPVAPATNENTTPVAPVNNDEPAVPAEVKDELAEYRTAAKKEIEDYNKDVLYSEENQTTVDGIKDSAYTLIDNADSKDAIDQIVKDTKDAIDEIEKLVDTTYSVSFYDFYGNLIGETQTVKYNEDATAPELEKVVINGVTYSFTKWDTVYTNVTTDLEVKPVYEITEVVANVYLNKNFRFTSLGTAKLNITDVVKEAIADSKNVTLARTDEKIKGMVDGTLPLKPTEINYKYAYYTLKYTTNEGFRIEANVVVDEEELARNTVVLTYKTEGNLVFYRNYKYVNTYSTTTTNGKNTAQLPTVYKFVGIGMVSKANVEWTDSEGNVVTNGTVFTKSTTLTAKTDKHGPVITLNGDAEKTVYQTNGYYTEEGFTVTDNYTKMSNRDVTTSITKDGKKVYSVDYSKLGKYEITYTAYDEDGNKGTATRTINVVVDTVESLELSRNNDTYYVGDKATNVTVKAVYASGKKVEVNTIKADTRVAGVKEDKVTYAGKDVTYNYTILEVVATGIELSRNNDTYHYGDPMHTVTVKLVYNNGKKDTLYSYTKTDFINTVAGNHTVTYTYGEFTADYNYEVITASEVTTVNGNYFLNEEFDYSNITIKYADGTTIKGNSDICSTTGFTTSSPVNGKSITVKCDGKEATYTYDVKYKVTLHGNKMINDYYLTFTLPNGASVDKVVYYDKNGVKNTLSVSNRIGTGKIVVLSKKLYDDMETMDGTNAKQKLEITYKKGTKITSTYTKTIKSN